jgi:hypothetical protein
MIPPVSTIAVFSLSPVLAFCHCNKIPSALIKRSGLFWLIVLEVLVLNLASLLPLDLWYSSTSWGECMMEQNHSSHGHEAKSSKEGPGVPWSPLRIPPHFDFKNSC